MKISAISHMLLLCGAAAIVTAGVGCDDESAETGDEQDASSSVDDVFAKTILNGGCSVKVVRTGNTVKTRGKDGKCPKTVSGILDLLAEDTNNKVNVFVVSEQADGAPGTKPDANTPYRMVIAVETKIGKNVQTADKLLISTLGSGQGLSETFIEVMSFNEKKGVFAFYDLKGGQWVQEGDGSQVATDALGSAPKFACLNCHTSGLPLMKELHDSWNNWGSTWLSMSDPGSTQELFNRLFSQRKRADDLEPLIVTGTKNATKARVAKGVKEGNLKGLLSQLMCDTAEPSLIGVHSKSSQRLGTVSTFSSMVPGSILVNNLLKTPSTGTGPQDGHDNIVNMNLPAASGVRVDSASYVKAITAMGSTIGGQPGDAMFPFFTPEMSYADRQMVQELFAQGFVDKDIVTDVLMTDFTISTFSDTRCALAETLPDTWADAEELRNKWIANLDGASQRGAAGLKSRLENKEDFAAHETAVNGFLTACNTRAAADKDAWALDLMRLVSQRRVEFIERYEAVVESDWLLPNDSLGSRAHGIRFNGTTCVVEDQSESFIGE